MVIRPSLILRFQRIPFSCFQPALRHLSAEPNSKPNEEAFNSGNSKNKRIRKYVLTSYVDYVKNYELLLEKRFPSAIKIYRIFKIGLKDFYYDLKQFISILRKVRTVGVENITRKELEIYFKMPNDMVRISPVLLISALPFVSSVIFPLAYLFPRTFLTSHFWSIQQKVEFSVEEQRGRLKYYKPVFRSLQARLEELESHRCYKDVCLCLALLGSGLLPTVDQVLPVRPLFCSSPYQLSSLSSRHLRFLCKMHNLSSFFRRKRRLREHAEMVFLMDRAIEREGGLKSLSHDEVRQACFLRGLNPTNMNHEEAVSWLASWLALTAFPAPANHSFLLHLPLFLSYNHPSNWVLTHSPK